MDEDPNIFKLDKFRTKPRRMTAAEMAERIGGRRPEHEQASGTPPADAGDATPRTHTPEPPQRPHAFTPEKPPEAENAPPTSGPLAGREQYFVSSAQRDDADNLHKHVPPLSSLEHMIGNLKESDKDGVISHDEARGFASDDDFLLKVMTTRLSLTNALRTGERIHPKDERQLEQLSRHLFSLWDALEQSEHLAAAKRRSFMDRIKEGLSGIVTTGTRRDTQHAMRQVQSLYRAIEEYENRFLVH